MNIKQIDTIIFDFDGVFTDNKVWSDKDGKEFIRCDRGDGLGIRILKNYINANNLNVAISIISKERNRASLARARKLRLEYHGGVDNKLDFIRRRMSRSNGNGLLYVGNDLNDLESMVFAEYSAAPADAHERIRLVASWTSAKCGGDGFVRDTVERLIDLPAMTQEEVYRLTH